MTQEIVSSCLIGTTYKKEVDKLKLGWSSKPDLFKKWTSLFYYRMNTSLENLPEVLLKSKSRTKSLIQ